MDSGDIINNNLKFENMDYRKETTALVYHSADWIRCTVEDIHADHKAKGYAGIGYHFFVGKDGAIWRGRPEDTVGAHCKGSNSFSIGICAEGSYMTEEMPAMQKYSLIALGIYLKKKYGIEKICGHKELFKETDCPGANYPMDEIRNAILNLKEEKEVEFDMERIVVYVGDFDIHAAIPVSQKNRCPVMRKSDFDISGITAKEVIQIGGKLNSDRFDSFKDAAGMV